MYQLLILLHLIAVLFYIILIIKTAYYFKLNKTSELKSSAQKITIILLYLILSGLIVSLYSSSLQSILKFCSKIGIYIVIFVIVEVLIINKIKALNSQPGKNLN